MSEKKMNSSRKHHLKSLMLSIAKGLLDEEEREHEMKKKRYMAETFTPVCMPRTMQELQCKEIHRNIDKIDEERYNLQMKVTKSEKEEKELRDLGDWRKNIEDKSGMDGRKKMFEAET
ncbi:troponin I, fast skeletal muscle-like isoform X2 [Takifugu rubripes]|uniref:troponin I, fast skeletal muscle-like isoform X2 n=1 Tax=Takifugu rubripes TaxID=31033 RepID=UPI0005D1DE1D|nr:troponin I, fast skeletal muscle-like isoform X2 [Takifugu rubripes]|eukprot:XP_011605427.1 PREDICTED: troponin I, fast skeletal muscle-like isoform X2 [Takifugu rubripes]